MDRGCGRRRTRRAGGGQRTLWHTRLRGDLYPNHGFGPVANYMDLNRGDRAVSITSVGTPALGLAKYRAQHMPPGDPSWKETYIGSDRTISLVQTAKGRVIRLEHDVSTPHPYSRINSLGGTNGVFEDYPARIYLEPDHVTPPRPEGRGFSLCRVGVATDQPGP